ncbi:MAG TPA: PRC-barrel domain-containing protein [Chloroflexota bacterium]
MSTQNAVIEPGMRVYVSDGEELGAISHVWTGLEETPASSLDYFKVTEGGFLGIGETALYIPFSAVDTVVPGESVTVNCGQEECIHRFTTKPDVVKKQERKVTQAEAAVIAATTPVVFH